MEPLGTHILAEYSGCDPTVLNDVDVIEELLRRAAEAAGATIIACKSHRLHPNGLASIIVLQESHMSIRSWPSTGYACADFFTCGDCTPAFAHSVLAEGLHAQSCETIEIERGLPNIPTMRVVGYRPTARIVIDCSSSEIPSSISVKRSPGRGLGLFSTGTLKRGDLIYETPVWLASLDTEYVMKSDAGESVLSADDLGTELTVPFLLEFPEKILSELADHYGLHNPSPVQLRDCMTEGGKREVLITEFDGLMNHSKNGNIQVDWPENGLSFEDNRPIWTIQILASRFIEAGDELFWDYTEAPDFIVPSDWQP